MTLPCRPSYCPGKSNDEVAVEANDPRSNITTREAALAFIEKQQTREISELKQECHAHSDSISSKTKDVSIEYLSGIRNKMNSKIREQKIREQLSHHLRNGKKLDQEIKEMFASEIAEYLQEKGIIALYEKIMAGIQSEEDKMMRRLVKEVKRLNQEFELDTPEKKLSMKIKLKYEMERNSVRSRYRSECSRLQARFNSAAGAPQTERNQMWSTRRFQRRKNLSSKSRDILMKWLQSNVAEPHPTEEEKIELAAAAKITVEQVSNWFVNARVRYVQVRNGVNVLVVKQKT
jgi:hypothetical protein